MVTTQSVYISPKIKCVENGVTSDSHYDLCIFFKIKFKIFISMYFISFLSVNVFISLVLCSDPSVNHPWVKMVSSLKIIITPPT